MWESCTVRVGLGWESRGELVTLVEIFCEGPGLMLADQDECLSGSMQG